MQAMKVKVSAEKRRPPLKNLECLSEYGEKEVAEETRTLSRGIEHQYQQRI
jgi:hypothetical protein